MEIVAVTSVRPSPETNELLHVASQATGLTRSELVNRCLEQSLKAVTEQILKDQKAKELVWKKLSKNS